MLLDILNLFVASIVVFAIYDWKNRKEFASLKKQIGQNRIEINKLKKNMCDELEIQEKVIQRILDRIDWK